MWLFNVNFLNKRKFNVKKNVNFWKNIKYIFIQNKNVLII